LPEKPSAAAKRATTANIRRYSEPGALKQIAPGHLLALTEDCISKVDARDVSKDSVMVVRMMDGAKPQPPQTFKPADF
jgi:hypothetical protein